MDSAHPIPDHALIHHIESRRTNPRVIDTANRPGLESRPQEGAVEVKAPRFVRKDGDVQVHGNANGNSSNQTKVDVVLISCPGADPEDTWSRNRIIGPWAWTHLRAAANIARVLVYNHGELEGKGLEDLARDLLEVLLAEIETTKSSNARPIFFICHSIGGLVLKFALVEASYARRYTVVLENAYGVTFFATPHQGSRLLSSPAYAGNTTTLLRLTSPLPAKLITELRPKDAALMSLHQDFKALANGLLIWSFYEEHSSTLFGAGSSGKTSEVLVSTLSSSILGVRHEKTQGIGTKHSNCASFDHFFKMKDYLEELAGGIIQANERTKDRDLNLEKKVLIEVHNFYDVSGLGYKDKNSKAQWVFSEDESLESFWTGNAGASLQTTLTADERDLEMARDHRNVQKGRAWSTALPTVASGSSDEGSKELRNFGRPLTAFTGRPSKPRDLEMRSDDSKFSALTHPNSEPGIAKGEFTGLHRTGNGSSLSPLPGENVSSSLTNPKESLAPPLCSASGSSGQERKTEVSPKFIWFHLPFNNPAWVDQVFNTFEKKKGWNFSRLFRAKDWLSQHAGARRSQPHGYFLKPTFILSPIEGDYSTKVGAQGVDHSRNTRDHIFLCFPFLQIDSYKAHLQRRNVVRKRIAQGCKWPVPAAVHNDNAPLEIKVIWEFLDHDTPLNFPRTLDQYRYPFVQDTRARDDDQMLYKMTKEMLYTLSDDSDDDVQGGEKGDETHSSCGGIGTENMVDILDGNILNVDQLWLWANDESIFTCFSQKQGDPQKGHLTRRVDLRNSILSELKSSPQQCRSTWELAALIIFHSVTTVMDNSAHPDLEVFRIFEKAISILTEMITASFKEFRTSSQHRGKVDDGAEPNVSSIRKQHILEENEAEAKNRNNMSALLELRDIEDELSTLGHLFEEQEKHISTMLEVYETTSGFSGACYQQLLLEAKVKVRSYNEQAREMIERVKMTRQDFDKFLDMLQRQAQIDEARLSRQQADLASTQQRSVMIFTVFTVIFLPLSFFSSVFGMNTHEWSGADNLRLRTIGLIALPSSGLLIVLTLLIAWSTSVRNALKNPKVLIPIALLWLMRLIDPVICHLPCTPYSPWDTLVDWVERRSVIEANRDAKERMQHDMKQDFWDINRQRNHRYQIPRRNRKIINAGANKNRNQYWSRTD